MNIFGKTEDGLNFIVPIEDARTMTKEYKRLYKEVKDNKSGMYPNPFFGMPPGMPPFFGPPSFKSCDTFSGFEFEKLPKSDYYLIDKSMDKEGNFLIVAAIGSVTIDGYINTITLFRNSLQYGIGNQNERKISEMKPLTQEEFEALVLECFVANKKELKAIEKAKKK